MSKVEIEWLINKGWPAAETMNTCWQIAQLSEVLVEWLVMTQNELSQNPLRPSVENILRTEILPYLLSDKHITRSENNTITWDNHSFDTSLVLIALSRIHKHYRQHFSSEEKREIQQIYFNALAGLVETPAPSQNLAGLVDSNLAVIAAALGTAKDIETLIPRIFLKRRLEHALASCIGELERRGRSRQAPERLWWRGQGAVLRELTLTLNKLSSQSPVYRKLFDMIRSGIEPLEQDLRQNKYISSERFEALNGYIYANLTLAQLNQETPHMDKHLILSYLFQYSWEVDHFGGSVYHSLQVTTEFADCLNHILCMDWDVLHQPLIELYQDAMREDTPSAYTEELRKDILEFKRREDKFRQHINDVNQANARRLFLITIIVGGPIACIVTGILIARFVGTGSGEERFILLSSIISAFLAVFQLAIYFRNQFLANREHGLRRQLGD